MTVEHPKDIDGSDDFTDEQLARLDRIQDAAYDFLKILAETDDIPRDLDAIWNLIYCGADDLLKQDRRVRIPTHVIDVDDSEYITDWYEE